MGSLMWVQVEVDKAPAQENMVVADLKLHNVLNRLTNFTKPCPKCSKFS